MRFCQGLVACWLCKIDSSSSICKERGFCVGYTNFSRTSWCHRSPLGEERAFFCMGVDVVANGVHSVPALWKYVAEQVSQVRHVHIMSQGAAGHTVFLHGVRH